MSAVPDFFSQFTDLFGKTQTAANKASAAARNVPAKGAELKTLTQNLRKIKKGVFDDRVALRNKYAEADAAKTAAEKASVPIGIAKQAVMKKLIELEDEASKQEVNLATIKISGIKAIIERFNKEKANVDQVLAQAQTAAGLAQNAEQLISEAEDKADDLDAMFEKFGEKARNQSARQMEVTQLLERGREAADALVQEAEAARQHAANLQATGLQQWLAQGGDLARAKGKVNERIKALGNVAQGNHVNDQIRSANNSATIQSGIDSMRVEINAIKATVAQHVGAIQSAASEIQRMYNQYDSDIQQYEQDLITAQDELRAAEAAYTAAQAAKAGASSSSSSSAATASSSTAALPSSSSSSASSPSVAAPRIPTGKSIDPLYQGRNIYDTLANGREVFGYNASGKPLNGEGNPISGGRKTRGRKGRKTHGHKGRNHKTRRNHKNRKTRRH